MRSLQKLTSIITLTNNGAELGAKLRDAMEGSDLFVPSHRAQHISDAHRFESVGDIVERAFKEYDLLILVFSLGIAVRTIAKCLDNKRRDPAVVVVDEKGRFAISVLSGHVGGANAAAKRIAELIGANPVITTASDINDTIIVDLLGQEFGWEIEDWSRVVEASAAVVNGEPVGVYQDAGEPWWPNDRSLPQNIRLIDTIEDLRRSEFAAGLIITDRLLAPNLGDVVGKSVVYRPKSLVLGVGCNRRTGSDEIEMNVRDALGEHSLSVHSVKCVATIDVKRTEPGLIDFAGKFDLPIRYFNSAELDGVDDIHNPSETVRCAVGCKSVCEAAALLAAGTNELIVTKTKFRNVTVAVARVPFGGRLDE